jgi:hypothetical protein
MFVNYNKYKGIKNWSKEQFKKIFTIQKFKGFTIEHKYYMALCILSSF